MAKLLKLRRGTTSQHSSFTGAEGEVTVDTDKETLVVHDGSTAGGHPVAAQDMDNVPAGAILGTQLENSGVTAGQYGSSTAIPIVTVDAQGLVTAASTTAVDSTTIANGTSNVAVANNGDITTTRSGTARFVVDNGGVVVTGGATISGSLNSGDVTLTSTQPKIVFNDSNDNPDYQIENVQGVFKIRDNTNSTDRFVVNTDGHVDVKGNLDCESGVDVTGNITCTGTVDGRDVAADGTKLDGIEAGATADQTAAQILTAIKTVDGAGSGLDADTLDGAQPNDAASQSTIVKRNSSGYIFANYLNTTANDVSSGVTKIMVETGNDNYIRHGDAGAVRSFINVENGATADQSAAEILSSIKTVDGSGSGLDADVVDGLQASSFLRADANDTAVGDLTLNGTTTFNSGAGAVTVGANSDIRLTNGSWTGDHACKIQHHDNYMYLQGGSNGIRFREGATDRVIIDTNGHLIPATNNTYNLGSSSSRWSNVYTNDLHLSNEGHSNEVDGTWGNWTIQEGESDLFLKNNRSGKKYKFNLTEVS